MMVQELGEENHMMMPVRTKSRPAGFTLVEILIVITIIALLLALSIAAVMRIVTAQQIKSSSDIVEKVQVAVDNQYTAIRAQAQLDIQGKGGGAQDAMAIINFFNGDQDAALALLTYCRVRQSFPQTFAEVNLPTYSTINGVNVPYFSINNYPFYVKSQFLPFVGTTYANSTLGVSQQSAALLYAAVAQTGAGGSAFVSDDATSGNQFDLQTAGQPTIHVYSDSWKQPIGFCRFGTNVELQNTVVSRQFPTIYVNTKSSTPLFQDPLDPSGKLYNLAISSPAVANSLAQILFVNNGDAANTTNFIQTSLISPPNQLAVNRRAVVYSTGYNQVYESLNLSPQTANTKATLDDILGYRLTQLGQRGTGSPQ
jgi:prepilin-type N-terminal cleavage/methylation domain-containing protein